MLDVNQKRTPSTTCPALANTVRAKPLSVMKCNGGNRTTLTDLEPLRRGEPEIDLDSTLASPWTEYRFLNAYFKFPKFFWLIFEYAIRPTFKPNLSFVQAFYTRKKLHLNVFSLILQPCLVGRCRPQSDFSVGDFRRPSSALSTPIAQKYHATLTDPSLADSMREHHKQYD